MGCLVDRNRLICFKGQFICKSEMYGSKQIKEVREELEVYHFKVVITTFKVMLLFEGSL